jgi:hypothetical protein
MKQVLHIFAKDTRRLWPEILTSFVVLALYAFDYPNRWNYSPSAMSRGSLIALPMLLMAATWWLLIARVVHAESLVGDRQWWLTRPYEWKRLLAAKALFIAVWIYVPFAIAQAAIVWEAGLSPFVHPAAWLWMLAFVSGYVLLPLVAIATVTENFARMTLTVVGAIVVWIGALFLSSMPRGGYESNVPDQHSMWIIAVLIAGAAAAVLLQFATRRVWLARGVAVATVVLATGVGMLLTATRESQIDRAYPVAGSSTAAVQLAFDPAAASAYAGKVTFGTRLDGVRSTPSERSSKVYIEVPILFSGIAEASAVQVDDVKVTVDDPHSGGHWTAPWWTSRNLRLLPGQRHAQVQIMVDSEQYERFKSGPITLHLALAVTELHAGSETTATISTVDFPVSGFGVCSTRWMYSFPSQLMCRAALDGPPLTRVSTEWSRTQEPNAYVPPGPITAASWAETPYTQSLVFRIFPVVPINLNLYPRSIHGPLSGTHGLALPPGTPVHFVPYTVTGRMQVALTIPNFQLPPEPR